MLFTKDLCKAFDKIPHRRLLKKLDKYGIKGKLLNWIITIHHERPCRIEISHPRGRKFNQGRGLPSPWLNSDPEGEISLFYMDRLMMDRFSPTFRRVFVRT